MSAAHETAVFDVFRSSFHKFSRVVQEELQSLFPDLPDTACRWIQYAAEYNVPGGKLNRGWMVVETLRLLVHGDGQGESLMEDAQCLGWAIEWMQAFFLVADDVMDGSLLRRGQPCWYQRPDVGLVAINDALILRSSISLLLRRQFAHPQRHGLQQRLATLFSEVELATEMGQLLDLTTKELFTVPPHELMQQYDRIVKYKTAIYSFYLPFACAFLLANQHEDVSVIAEERAILLEIGRLFQIQDDVLDVFGNVAVTGKVGTDIEERKCTWLLCHLLSRPSFSACDRELLISNYGVKDHVAAETVRQIYRKYRLYDDFVTFEQDARLRIESSIAKLARPQSILAIQLILARIIKRVK